MCQAHRTTALPGCVFLYEEEEEECDRHKVSALSAQGSTPISYLTSIIRGCQWLKRVTSFFIRVTYFGAVGTVQSIALCFYDIGWVGRSGVLSAIGLRCERGEESNTDKATLTLHACQGRDVVVIEGQCRGGSSHLL